MTVSNEGAIYLVAKELMPFASKGYFRRGTVYREHKLQKEVSSRHLNGVWLLICTR